MNKYLSLEEKISHAKDELQKWFNKGNGVSDFSSIGGATQKCNYWGEFDQWIGHDQPCFAAMTRWKYKRSKDEEIFYSSLKTAKKYKKSSFLEWVSFIVGEESPWVNVVKHLHTRNPEEIYEDRGLIFRNFVDIPHMELFNFLIGSRFYWEFSPRYPLFEKCLDEGFSKKMSAYIALCFRDDGVFSLASNAAHMCISGTPKHHAYRFVNGKPRESKPIADTDKDRDWRDCESIWKVILNQYPKRDDFDMTSLIGVRNYVLEICAAQELIQDKPVKAHNAWELDLD